MDHEIATDQIWSRNKKSSYIHRYESCLTKHIGLNDVCMNQCYVGELIDINQSKATQLT